MRTIRFNRNITTILIAFLLAGLFFFGAIIYGGGGGSKKDDGNSGVLNFAPPGVGGGNSKNKKSTVFIPPRVKVVKKRPTMSGGKTKEKKDPNPQLQQQHVKGKEGCHFPELKLDAPTILKFLSTPKPLECWTVEKNWVYAEKGKFYLDPEAVAKHGGAEAIQCDYSNFYRVNDDKVNVEKVMDFKHGSDLKGDFFKIDCLSSADSSTYSNVHAAVVASKAALARAAKPPKPLKGGSSAAGLNVYIAGFDSLSRLMLMRKLPKLYQYFTETMQGVVLEGYNIVGDGTPQALIPIFTGKTEVELPLTRKRYPNANYVDVYPFVWNEYKDAGYATLYGEDAARVGTFTYRLKGFKEQPTDHYMRTFYMIAEQLMSKNKYLCWGSEEHHKTHFDYVRHFWEAYPSETRKFAFQFHAYLSHDYIDNVELADDYMLDHFRYFVDNNHWNDTIIVLMSDHGHRFANLRETQQGKLEERLPFFGFSFPPWFASRYPEAMEAFRTNARSRLTTPFDIHATLQDILRRFDRNGGGNQNGRNNESRRRQEEPPHKMEDLKKNRQLSLFREIPPERTCQDAGVEPHWCTCLDWTEVPTEDPAVAYIAHEIVAVINAETEPERNLCSELKLAKIDKASKYAPANALLSYKASKDKDGFVADLTGNSTVQVEYYQLDLWTEPGSAHYEAQVTLERAPGNELTIDLDLVSHVNKYGDLPHCIVDKDYFLAKWCVCYDKIRVPAADNSDNGDKKSKKSEP